MQRKAMRPVTPISFAEVNVGQKFRTVVDAGHIVRMKTVAGPSCSGPFLPNCVELEGPHVGHADWYAPVAMVFLIV